MCEDGCDVCVSVGCLCENECSACVCDGDGFKALLMLGKHSPTELYLNPSPGPLLAGSH